MIKIPLPNVKPGEKEASYVSRCIRFETKQSPDRPKDQIARMCYEKYRKATGGKRPPGVKSKDKLDKTSELLNNISKSLDTLRKNV